MRRFMVPRKLRTPLSLLAYNPLRQYRLPQINKHYCVLSNSGLSNATVTVICVRNLHLLKIRILFPVSLSILHTKSTLINFNSVRIFLTIRKKTLKAQSRNCQNRNMHISKIGHLFPVCLRKSRR